ncbi:MAG: hypothetical protein GY745_10745 [Actinomycetia bacterium]|nr:hypothetical protein [Actinomycetes bacterium]MCP3909937.1 hypothetical protein [Actinomycetes bacterium]MCP4085514.1 hypothetical protein [Actinomycetes bacterium]
MSDLVCTNCGEEENLLGEQVDEVITITCEECGLVWDRDLTPRCRTCGREDVRPAFQAIVEKSRGTQLSIQSMKLVYLCPGCNPELLARWIESNSPLPPDELPI